ncbi:SDR family NAD(P)-dependent oxidoreductase [Acinetobacter pragensis]|uniref:Short-chain dehydrogenase n=1 Tax=Acinetobacter pragensis TaxID=1806892 RepID=A0A151XZH4_9GAMM|nr:SDR family NAD(P)-dependent oxidoreductase [Acinetobacter pragensis]KYQ71029.1 short-chain dehydrogenase [Acinetobacter pragensis]
MTQRTVLITGAGQGIGAGLAKILANAGYKIIATDINQQNCEKLLSELAGTGHLAYGMDVSDEQQVQHVFAEAEAKAGGIDCLVCAAGILILHNGQRKLIVDTDLSEWELTHTINTRGTFLCTREFVRARIQSPVAHGRIVTFSSCAAQLGGYRSSSAYISSKAAVLGYTKALAREVAEHQITVNGIAPGLIDTAMLRLSMKDGQEQAAASNIPLQRLGQVEDIAAAIQFLISEQAAYITGSMIDVNGGYRMQ